MNAVRAEGKLQPVRFDHLVQRRLTTKLEPWTHLPTILSHKVREVIIPRDEIVKSVNGRIKARILVIDLLGNASYSKRKRLDFDDVVSFFATPEEHRKFIKQQNDFKEYWEREDS